ncbi:unnamed protein product [Rotaria sordida]|uniref:MULE transposase domain-containing protein n=1 Tax=Rotaria sordida TaxID=392033 RepID=A0A815HGB7_9BILA|nr:unnamed protein product [Rotaria sordida]CAF1351439.1 unnamed protein product [Rotaria sordida]
MSIVKSSKNKDQLLLDGFRYTRAKESQTVGRCCRNICADHVRFDGTIYINVQDHIYASNAEETIAMEFKLKIVASATTSHYPPRRIIHEALLNIPLPRPNSFDDIYIPDELRVANSGSRFLLSDNENNSDRMIILSSDDDLDRLSNSDYSHTDGTFKARIAPQLFHQLYTIHGILCGRSLPLVYCIISGKSEEIHDEMFDVVLKHISQRPKSITIEYEKAVLNVIKQKLPMTTHSVRQGPSVYELIKDLQMEQHANLIMAE